MLKIKLSQEILNSRKKNASVASLTGRSMQERITRCSIISAQEKCFKIRSVFLMASKLYFVFSISDNLLYRRKRCVRVSESGCGLSCLPRRIRISRQQLSKSKAKPENIALSLLSAEIYTLNAAVPGFNTQRICFCSIPLSRIVIILVAFINNLTVQIFDIICGRKVILNVAYGKTTSIVPKISIGHTCCRNE